MRDLEINKQLIYYAQPLPPQPILDEDGYETGEMDYTVTSEPKPYRINISSAKGEMATRQFGELEEYDKIMVIWILINLMIILLKKLQKV